MKLKYFSHVLVKVRKQFNFVLYNKKDKILKFCQFSILVLYLEDKVFSLSHGILSMIRSWHVFISSPDTKIRLSSKQQEWNLKRMPSYEPFYQLVYFLRYRHALYFTRKISIPVFVCRKPPVRSLLYPRSSYQNLIVLWSVVYLRFFCRCKSRQFQRFWHKFRRLAPTEQRKKAPDLINRK